MKKMCKFITLVSLPYTYIQTYSHFVQNRVTQKVDTICLSFKRTGTPQGITLMYLNLDTIRFRGQVHYKALIWCTQIKCAFLWAKANFHTIYVICLIQHLFEDFIICDFLYLGDLINYFSVYFLYIFKIHNILISMSIYLTIF